MFEVGKRYEFKMIIDGDETTFWREIEHYEHPLIKLRDVTVGSGSEQTILRGETINVTSPNFISAVIKD